MVLKNLRSIDPQALYVKNVFFPQNRLNLFIQVIEWYLKTFIFDNSSPSPKTAEIYSRSTHSAPSLPPTFHHYEQKTYKQEDGKCRIISCLKNILWRRRGCNACGRESQMYKIIKNVKCEKHIVASQKVFHKIASIYHLILRN